MERGGRMGVGVNSKEGRVEKKVGDLCWVSKKFFRSNVEIRNLSSSQKQPIYRDRLITITINKDSLRESNS
jgi:hypothetical protein